MKNNRIKIKNIYKLIEKNGLDLALALFIEDFLHASNKYELIEEEIGYINRESCLITAIVHKLAINNNIELPTWIFDEKYVCKEKYFQFDTTNKNYQEFLIKNSPKEFADRNVYFTENLLSRI